MQLSFILALAASSLVSGMPFTHQHAHDTRSAPSNPISVASASYMCNVKSDMSVYRDLGFVGKIQDTVIYTYGDTSSSTSQFYMTSDSSSIGTNDPCLVHNTQRTSDSAHPNDMVSPIFQGETNTADAFGGTNVVPVAGNLGAMFFLKNHRPIGGNDYIRGAGVANVYLSDDKNVSTFRLAEFWWDSLAGEPWYGDIGAYNDGTYIYGYGHGHSDHMNVYLTRAPITGYNFLINWQYWDGSTNTWSNNRLYNPSPAQGLQWNAAEGAAWAVGQGQMIWSSYYNKIIWVYGIDWADDNAGNYGVYARTADTPTGPWSAATHLYSVQRLTNDRAVYAMVANPYFDDSGKSIVVTVDNGADTVQATKVIFH